MIAKILAHALVRPSSLAPSLPDAFDGWFLRSCAKAPGDRFGSVAEQWDALSSALGAAATATSGHAFGPPRRTAPQLPVALTRFVGREGELAELTDAMSGVRLMTLTGPGGVGKTRMALQLATQIADRFDDGCLLIELASVADPHRVAAAIADVVAPDRATDARALEATLGKLERLSALLVLDNAEHVAAGVSAIASAILRRAPRVKILATSRAPLDVPGELVHALSPLGLPATGAGVDDARASASVALFEARARLVKPSLRIDASNAPVVAAICRRLDGLPLGIELAAARLSSLSVTELLGRLDDPFRDLVSRDPQSMPHQRTLLATLEWSWNLLGDAAKRIYPWLAVCAGGFGIDAASALGRGAGLSEDASLAAVDELVRHSMVVHDELDGRTRYRMLTTMRDHGRRKLAESHELDAAQRALFDWTSRFFHEVGHRLEGPEQATWLRRVDAEHDNLRAALTWSYEDAPELGLKLASVAARFWSLRGHLQEGVDWCTRFLGKAPRAAGPLRARSLTALGGLLELRLGRMQSAVARLEEARGLLRDGDPRGLAWATFYLGLARFDPRLPAAARELFAESQAAFEKCGDFGGYAFSTLMWGYALLEEDPAKSLEVAEKLLVPARSMGHPNLIGHTLELHVCADLARGVLDADDGLRLREAFDAYASLGNHACATHTLDVLGFAALRQDDTTRAGVLFGASEAERRRLGRVRVGYEDARAVLGQILGSPDDRDLAGGLALGASMSLREGLEYGWRSTA